MKKLLLILVFVSFLACATTGTQPVVQSPEQKTEEVKKKEQSGDSWPVTIGLFGLGILASKWLGTWPW